MRGYLTALCVVAVLVALLAGARRRVTAHDALQAAANGDVDTVRRALDAGIDLDACGGPMMCYAAGAGDDESIALLLSHGVDPDAPLAGTTALRVAAFRGDIGIITRLLRAGAAPSNRSSTGETALDVARRAGHDEAAALLAGGGNHRPCRAARQDAGN